MKIAVIVMIVFSLVIAASAAQDTVQVITVSNILQLQSAAQVDFADLTQEPGQVQNGWFAVNARGDQFVVKSRNEHVVWLDQTGKLLADYVINGADGFPVTVMDAAFDQAGESVLSVHAGGGAFYIARQYLGATSPYIFKFQSEDVPIRVWQGRDSASYAEVVPSAPMVSPYILKLPDEPLELNIQLTELDLDDVETVPVAPNNDPESYHRVGRIAPPLAISITEDGLLKRWNLETDELTTTVEIGEIPVLGAVNASASHFAWRDNESTQLHLLDFETGIDKEVSSLGGTYIPFLLLSANADVIIGVNVGEEPNVIAWDVATGDRHNLGDYRTCNRQPDFVRLSRDGSTLVIGCDTGLDIWRVSLGNS